MLFVMSRTAVEVPVDWSCSALCMLAESPVSHEQDDKKSSVAAQSWRRLYITNISRWRLLISQVSIGRLCRGDQSGAANQWGHFILLERLFSDPGRRLVGLTLILFFSGVYYEKEWVESDEHCGVGSVQLLVDVHSICARILLCLLHCQEPTELAQTFEFALLISVHVIPSHRYRLSTDKVSLDYLQYLSSQRTCVISAKMERGFCTPRAAWRFHRITELCSVRLTFEIVKADVHICLFSSDWHLHVAFCLG